MARNLEDTGKHLIRILRQGGQAANIVIDAVLDGRDDIIRKVMRGMKSNLNQNQLNAIVTKSIADLGRNLNAILVAQGTAAGEAQASSTARYLAVLGVASPRLYSVTERFIRRSFKRPMAAQNISVDDLLTGTMAHMRKSIVNVTRTAIADGETIAQTSKFIRESVGSLDDPNLRRKADALARTAIVNVSNDVRKSAFVAEPEVEKLLYVATLDHRTTNICKSLDGQVWPKKEARVPPLHVGCRSTLVPILKGESVTEVKDQLRRPAVEPKSVAELEKRGLKTSGGKIRKPSVSPQSPLKGVQKQKYMTYEQWLKTQSVTYQKAILGPKAYNKFKSTGNLTTALGVAE